MAGWIGSINLPVPGSAPATLPRRLQDGGLATVFALDRLGAHGVVPLHGRGHRREGIAIVIQAV
jgi:hypothetical protein